MMPDQPDQINRTPVMAKLALRLFAGALLLGTLACRLTTPATETAGGTDESDVATQVAATLSALTPAAVEPTVSTPDEPAAATATPVPTLDELTVVYIEDGIPWLTTVSGPPVRLSDSSAAIDVLISDDGQRVVFLHRPPDADETQPLEIRIVNADGSGERTLLTAEEVNALYPRDGMLRNDLSQIEFIPGSHSLLFNTRAVPEGPGLLKHDDLLRLDHESGAVTTLFPPGEGGDFLISPDGRRVAIIRPDSISLANSDGSGLQPELVRYEPVITYSEFQYYAQPIWSQDSSELAVMIPSSDPLAEDPSGTLWRINLEGEVDEVTTLSGDFYFQQFGDQSVVSPDFRRFALPRDTEEGLELSLASFTGEEIELYDSGARGWIGWNPSGSHFVYRKGGVTELHLGTIDSPPRGLVEGTEFRWADDEGFLYLAGSRGNWTLRSGSLGDPPVDLAESDDDFMPFDFAAPAAP